MNIQPLAALRKIALGLCQTLWPDSLCEHLVAADGAFVCNTTEAIIGFTPVMDFEEGNKDRTPETTVCYLMMECSGHRIHSMQQRVLYQGSITSGGGKAKL